MNKLLLLGLAATLGAAKFVLMPANPPVELQATTPGVPQAGHLNISGTATSKVVRAETVFGNSTATTGVASGGDFRSASTSGRGFYALASALTGTTYGGFFQNSSSTGRAVFGLSTGIGSTNYGGYFQAAGSSARGVFGITTSTSGVTYGVLGKSTSAAGFGVYSDGNLGTNGVISGNGSGITNVNASFLGGLPPASFLTAIPNPLNLTGNTANPTMRAENAGGTAIFGWSKATSGSSSAGYFQSDSPEANALNVIASASSGGAVGLFARSQNMSGLGVEGWGNTGVKGRNTIGSGPGVLGTALAGNTGIQGMGTGGGTGVYGQSDTGWGVFGHVTNAGGTGGYFWMPTGVIGIGVRAVSGSAFGFAGYFEGPGVAVNATSDSTQAIKAYNQLGAYDTVFAENQEATLSSSAIRGKVSTSASNSTGVRGESVSGFGVLGEGPVGVFALGDLDATGNKSFRIDHPSDPEHKFLLHYAAESPYPQNFYSGNIRTDGDGYAWVTLPDYFSSINANFKYQLTVVGKNFAQAIVSEEIQGNRFQVRTNAPNVKVSWRVEADRNDLYDQKKRPKDVVDKQPDEVGKYQMPELYGLPADRGLFYRPVLDKNHPHDTRSTVEPPAVRKLNR